MFARPPKKIIQYALISIVKGSNATFDFQLK